MVLMIMKPKSNINEFIEKLKYEVYFSTPPHPQEIAFAIVNAIVALQKEIDKLNKQLGARTK